MFGKKEKTKKTREDIDSLIGENIEIKGEIKGIGSIRIDGVIKGDIDYDGNIIIGDVNSSSLIIHENAKFEGSSKMLEEKDLDKPSKKKQKAKNK